MNIDSQITKHNLMQTEYRPIIQGESPELFARLESQKDSFPKTGEIFGNILQTRSKQHPQLEDWLIIPHYQFFWDNDTTALTWLETLFNESIELMGISAWKQWQEELLQQTNCPTTHAICNRLYDYQLQLCGGLYLARDGWTVEFIPRCKGKSPDYRGTRGNKKCILECKFVHTSEKYGSFILRFNKAARKYAKPHPPLLFCEEFQLPSSLKIKELTPQNCTAIKEFIQTIYTTHPKHLTGILDGKDFIYYGPLPTCPVPIDSQCESIQNQAGKFANEYLARTINEKSLQLKNHNTSECSKILFIGLQPDRIYLSPFLDPVDHPLSKIKEDLKPFAKECDVELIFSDDVGFPFTGYL